MTLPYKNNPECNKKAVGLINGIIGLNMKKFLLIFLSITICFCFSSCNSSNPEKSGNTQSDSSLITNESNDKDTNDSISQNNNNDDKNTVTFRGKTISNIQLDFNGNRMDIDTDGSAEFLNLQSLEEVSDVVFTMELGKLIIIYDDGNEEIFGNVLTGQDNGFYLKTPDDNKIYKISDLSF